MFSLLDNDLYQFTMSQAAFHHCPDWSVRYAFKNRSVEIPLLQVIALESLVEHVEAFRTTTLSPLEINYLRRMGIFQEDYLSFLGRLRLPEVEIGVKDNWLSIEYEADWPTAMFWETPLLYLVKSLYHNAMPKDEKFKDKTLFRKLEILKQHPELPGFIEMGTRRRPSQAWQQHVIDVLYNEVPQQLLGTSNVLLSSQFEHLPAMGTIAHQWHMVITAMNYDAEKPIETGQISALAAWELEYGKYPWMMCHLTDTYGTPSYLSRLNNAQAAWPAYRQDSGDPFIIGDIIIEHLRYHKLNPLDHKIIFSDALNLEKMLSLYYNFVGQVGIAYGWGEGIIADCGYQNPNMVIKPISVNGIATVKLSDDLSKATGVPEAIEFYKGLE